MYSWTEFLATLCVRAAFTHSLWLGVLSLQENIYLCRCHRPSKLHIGQQGFMNQFGLNYTDLIIQDLNYLVQFFQVNKRKEQVRSLCGGKKKTNPVVSRSVTMTVLQSCQNLL